MSSTTDPFLVVKEDVEKSVKNAQALYARLDELLSGGSGDSEEIGWCTNELNTLLKSIEWDIEDLSETIAIVEESPGRFKIGPGEIQSRKAFIAQTQRTVQDIRANTNSARTKGKQHTEQRSALMSGGRGGSRYARLEADTERQNQGFIDGQEQQQQTIMREQDTQLEEVTATIGVLRNMGQMIGDELDDQNELLEEFDAEMDSTTDKLKAALKKVDKALAISKDGKLSCTICLLLLGVIILIIVFFTK